MITTLRTRLANGLERLASLIRPSAGPKRPPPPATE
jgi:hypothetical protein